MKFKMFMIYDRMSGLYGSPTCQVNVECGKRWFGAVLSKSDCAEDLDLYEVGAFDSETGSMSAIKPKFVCSLATLRAEAEK